LRPVFLQARDVRMNGEYGASGTSFYTTTEKEDYYDTLEAVLEKKCAGTMAQPCLAAPSPPRARRACAV
jgi:hypothetical protein